MDLQQKLTMTHLEDETSESTNEKLKNLVTKPEPVEISGDDPKMQERYTFSVDVETPNKKKYKALVTTKILTVGEKQKLGALEAALAEGQQVYALPDETRATNKAMAHMALSIVDVVQETPKGWVTNLSKLFHFEPLYALWEEVASHEATFLGYTEDQEGSEEPEKDG